MIDLQTLHGAQSEQVAYSLNLTHETSDQGKGPRALPKRLFCVLSNGQLVFGELAEFLWFGQRTPIMSALNYRPKTLESIHTS